MNIVEIIKKAPKDHVYWCTLFGSCRVSINTDEEDAPIVVYGFDECKLTEDGRLFPDAYDGECVLFPSKDNRDWEAFERELMGITEGRQYVLRRVFGEEELPLSTEFEIEGGSKAVLSRFCGISGINLDHEYYKEHPYIDFQIDGKEYKVSIEDIKRLAMNSTKDIKERLCVVDSDKYSINIEDKEKVVSGKSSFDNTFDGTAEMVSIPDRPMMAAVIMSGLLAGGFKDSAGVLANKAVHYADIILKHTEEENNDKGTDR